MKKLILITTIILLNALLIINTQCDALNTPGQNFLQTLAARFAALKSYLFQPTSTFLKNRYQLPQQKPPFPLFTTTQTPPFVQYDPLYQRAILYTSKNITKDFGKIDNYYFSPTKKYLIIKTSSPGVGLRLTGQEQLFGYNQTIALIETSSGRTIKEFEGNVVMFEFSPNEETLVIATAYNPTGTFGNIRNIHQTPSKEHQSSSKQRKQMVSGEILFYEIFDIPTKLITTKLENVQATQFTAYNDLFIKYDDNVIDKINLSNKQQSINNQFKQVINYFTRGYLLDEVDYSPKYEKDTNIPESDNFIKANYHYYDKTLTITLPNQAAQSFNQVNFYSFSPQRNYIIINKQPEGLVETFKSIAKTTGFAKPSNNTETIIYSTQSNPTELSLMNVITYEFSPDEKTLLVLNELPTPTYKLFNLHDNQLIKEFADQKNIKSMYFTPNGELIAINQDGEKISYDTTTGETFEERQNRLQQEKRKQQEEERRKQEQEKIAQEKQEKERIAEEKRALEEIANEKKRKEEEQKTLTKIYSEVPHGEERLERVQEQQLTKPTETATQAVQTRGFEAVKQAASGIASDITSGIKEYLFPSTETSEVSAEKITPLTEAIVHSPEPEITIPLLTPTAAAPTTAEPTITPSDDSEDEFEELEDKLEERMNRLKEIINSKKKEGYHEYNASMRNKMLNLTNELNIVAHFFEYEKFVNLYNKFTQEQKEEFNQYFFLGNNKKRSITNNYGETVIFSIDDNSTMSVIVVNKEISAAGGAAEQ